MNIEETVASAKNVVADIKDITESGNDVLQNIQGASAMMNSDNQALGAAAESGILATPMVAKSSTVKLMWITVAFTIVLFAVAIACLVLFDKDLTPILTQSLGYSIPITLGCLTKRGAEYIAVQKYTNQK